MLRVDLKIHTSDDAAMQFPNGTVESALKQAMQCMAIDSGSECYIIERLLKDDNGNSIGSFRVEYKREA